MTAVVVFGVKRCGSTYKYIDTVYSPRADLRFLVPDSNIRTRTLGQAGFPKNTFEIPVYYSIFPET